MKSLRSTCAALAACGLLFSAASSAFAAAPKDYQITGTVSELTETTVTLTTNKKETWGFARTADTKLPDGAKVGDKVTVHYTMTAGTVDAKPEAAASAKKEKAAPPKTSKKAKGDAATEPAASGSPSKPAAEAASPTP